MTKLKWGLAFSVVGIAACTMQNPFESMLPSNNRTVPDRTTFSNAPIPIEEHRARPPTAPGSSQGVGIEAGTLQNTPATEAATPTEDATPSENTVVPTEAVPQTTVPQPPTHEPVTLPKAQEGTISVSPTKKDPLEVDVQTMLPKKGDKITPVLD